MHFKSILFAAIVGASNAKTDTSQVLQSTTQITEMAAKTENTATSLSPSRIALGAGAMFTVLAMPVAAIAFIYKKVRTKEETRKNDIDEPQIADDAFTTYKIHRLREERTKRHVDERLPSRNPKALFRVLRGPTYLDYHNHPKHPYWKEHKPLHTFYKWLENSVDATSHMEDFVSQVKYVDDNDQIRQLWIKEYSASADKKLMLDLQYIQRNRVKMVRPILNTKIFSALAHIIHKITIVHGYVTDEGLKTGITASCKDENFDYTMVPELKPGETYNDGCFGEFFEFARGSCQRLLHIVWCDDNFEEIRNSKEQGVKGYTLEFGENLTPLSFASYNTSHPGRSEVWAPIAVANAKGFEGVLQIHTIYRLETQENVNEMLHDLDTVASVHSSPQKAFTLDYRAMSANTHISSLQDLEALIEKGEENNLFWPRISAGLDFTLRDVVSQHLNSRNS